MANNLEAPVAHPTKSDTAKSSSIEPIIINLGKKNRLQVRKLRRGKPGRLLDRVQEAIDQLRANGDMAAGTKPVVIVIRQRAKNQGRRMAKAWGLG